MSIVREIQYDLDSKNANKPKVLATWLKALTDYDEGMLADSRYHPSLNYLIEVEPVHRNYYHYQDYINHIATILKDDLDQAIKAEQLLLTRLGVTIK